MTRRRRWSIVLSLALVLAAGLVAVVAPTAARAGDIATPGPLRLVRVSPDLNCNVLHVLDTSAEWYSNTACGTFASLNGTVFGPRTVPGATFARTALTPVSQSALRGSGTAADPYTIVTVVDAGTRARLVQTDTYVVGREYYDTSVAVTNLSATTQVGNLYTAADCFLQNADVGFGRVSGTAPACTTSTSPGSRVEQLLPRTGGNAYVEGRYSTVWSSIGTQ